MNRPAHRPPIRSGISPESERDFARHIADGLSPTEAARLAGFPSSVRPLRAMESAGFAIALHQAVANRLKQGAPEAVAVLLSILRDKAMPARVRVDAAKAVLDRSGHVAGPAVDGKGLDTDTQRMTPDQLEALIARLERDKSDRAMTVGGSDVPASGTPADFLN